MAIAILITATFTMSSLYNNRLTYAILGTGALGGYYGACLQRAGLEVHFLLNSDYGRVKQHEFSLLAEEFLAASSLVVF